MMETPRDFLGDSMATEPPDALGIDPLVSSASANEPPDALCIDPLVSSALANEPPDARCIDPLVSSALANEPPDALGIDPLEPPDALGIDPLEPPDALCIDPLVSSALANEPPDALCIDPLVSSALANEPPDALGIDPLEPPDALGIDPLVSSTNDLPEFFCVDLLLIDSLGQESSISLSRQFQDDDRDVDALPPISATRRPSLRHLPLSTGSAVDDAQPTFLFLVYTVYFILMLLHRNVNNVTSRVS